VTGHRPDGGYAETGLSGGLPIGLDHVVPDLMGHQQDHQRNREDHAA
jgi:hypothetical protein